jgi:hypothetical protein
MFVFRSRHAINVLQGLPYTVVVFSLKRSFNAITNTIVDVLSLERTLDFVTSTNVGRSVFIITILYILGHFSIIPIAHIVVTSAIITGNIIIIL